MSYRYTKTSRHRLKAHDAGQNRHTKGLAYELKLNRLEDERRRVRDRRRKRATT